MAQLLWCPAYQPGSYFPAVPIALELQARGHRIVVLCESASEEPFRRLGFDFQPTSDVDAYLAGVAIPTDVATKRAYLAGYVRALTGDTSRTLAAAQYDAVLTDPLETGADFAAELAGIPWASYAHFAMDEAGPDVPFTFHFWDRRRSPEEDFVEFWNGLRTDAGLAPEPRPPSEHRWYRHSPHRTLILGIADLVHPRGELPPYAVRVGPTQWEPPTDAAIPEWIERLGIERAAILASVSTTRQHDLDVVVSIAEAMRAEPLDVVATVARSDELPPLPPNVRVTGFVPHSQLLEHVDVVACHAGYGTVTRATLAGIPTLLLPWGRDQFQVTRGATHAGVAIELKLDGASAAEVRAAIYQLIGDSPQRRRAEQLATECASLDAPAAAAKQVEQLLRPASGVTVI